MKFTSLLSRWLRYNIRMIDIGLKSTSRKGKKEFFFAAYWKLRTPLQIRRYLHICTSDMPSRPQTDSSLVLCACPSHGGHRTICPFARHETGERSRWRHARLGAWQRLCKHVRKSRPRAGAAPPTEWPQAQCNGPLSNESMWKVSQS